MSAFSESPETTKALLDHYGVVGSLIQAELAGCPIVYANEPARASGVRYHVTDVPLSATKLLWCVHRFLAVEFHTWAPLSPDSDRLRFARVLLELPDGPFERVKEAALAMRAALFEANVEAVPLVDGKGGIALWIPLADAPSASAVRAWLHTISNTATQRNPKLLTTEPNTHRDGRVHVHVSSNAPGHYSAVPYSARAIDGLPVCTPIAWEELGTVNAVASTVTTLPARITKCGDVFAVQLEPIASQAMTRQNVTIAVSKGHTPEPRGHIINAAIEILEDGKVRTADELCAEAIARKLVPPTTTRKYVYSALIEYIARATGRNRKPPIVQDEQRRFRINEPLDDWPALTASTQAVPDDAVPALCDRLDVTSTGDDPAAFESAVCDAFAHLGFLTQHLGGHGQPDGVADAILGTLGYRIALECKTAKTIVNEPDCAEAAKEMTALGADYSVLVGPAFSDETELLSELQTHKVTALTVADLQTLLRMAATALEVRSILVPGYASDVIGDFVWTRQHGEAKRVATVAAIIQTEAWKSQLIAAQQRGGAQSPRMTIDAAMLVVDEALCADGSTEPCTREEVQQAVTWLASPNVAAATLDNESLIATRNPAGSSPQTPAATPVPS